MKYPQLVSMPSTVQDWLDEQLEARGIDAVVYTRYIFSLLQRDTLDLPDDLLTLSSGKSKKFGIEKLVDELCAKLKEIQSEGENHCHSSPSQPSVSKPQAQSLSDQAQKYYAAFPPLNKCVDTSTKVNTLNTDQSSAWRSKKVLANSFGRNKQQSTSGIVGKTLNIADSVENKENRGKNESSSSNDITKVNMRSRNHMKEKDWSYNAGKEFGYALAWNYSGDYDEHNDTSTVLPVVECVTTGWRVSKYNRQNKGEPQISLASEEPLSLEREIWDIGSCGIYERQMQIEQKVNVDKETMQNFESEPGQSVDENLAQLIAKFDHSIEALWSPNSGSENRSPRSRLSLSPLEKSEIINADQGKPCNKNIPVASLNNSFIHCGTNIRSSIWSSQPTDTVPLSMDEKKFNLAEQTKLASRITMDIESNESHYLTEGKKNVNRLVAVTDSTEKIVGSKSANIGHHLHKKSVAIKSYPFTRLGSNVAAESMKMDMAKTVWNKFEGFPSLSTAFLSERKDCLPTQELNTVWNARWPTAENSNVLVGNFPRYNMFPNCQAKQQSCNIFSDGSFGTLNHNREDSSFTEVIPKHSLCSFASDKKLVSPQVGAINKHSDGMYPVANETKQNDASENNKEKDEEDLLTSTRTHFRPIRQESSDSHNNNGCYADGTTFVIPNSLESVPFKRSESGALYLETDLGIETPKKYMEYKEKEYYSGRHKAVKSPDKMTSLVKDFVPKFRVHQIEKCCQTEGSDDNITSDEEVDTKRSRQELKENEFYFPGDEHFAEKIVNCLESDDEHLDQSMESGQSFCMLATTSNANENKVTPFSKLNEQHQTFRMSGNIPMSSEEMSYRWSAAVKNCCKCNRNNFSAWKTDWIKESSGFPTPHNGIWGPSGSTVQPHPWCDIWSGTNENEDTCKKCADAEHTSAQAMSPQHLKLREELTMDGEQLLSDLSYMQHLYQGSDSNDNGVGCNEKMQCLSPPNETCNDVQLYDDSNFGGSQVARMNCSPNHEELEGKENESFGVFAATCSPRMLPIKVLLSMEVDAEKKMNERPFSLKMSAKDRKRRHSGCLRQVGNNQQYEVHSVSVHAGHEPSTVVGCRLWTISDTTRLKGSCAPRLLRPVTL